MDQIEYLREKLYKVIESGDTEHVLKISQELDKLILIFMENSDSEVQKSA